MHCKDCDTDKPEAEMKTDYRCIDCYRRSKREAYWRSQANKPHYSKQNGESYHMISKDQYDLMVKNTELLARRFA